MNFLGDLAKKVTEIFKGYTKWEDEGEKTEKSTDGKRELKVSGVKAPKLRNFATVD